MSENLLKTGLLMFLISALFVSIGSALAGPQGAICALLVAFIINGLAYWNSDQLVLSYYQTQSCTPESYPDLYQKVEELSNNAHIPTPAVYIISDEQPNAFATGRNPENSAIALTTGLLSLLDEREIKGVISHELAHIVNRDTLIATITASIAGAISSLAQWSLLFGGNHMSSYSNEEDESSIISPVLSLILAIFAPIAALIVQMTISRSREFEADRLGAFISGDPEGLARALEAIEEYVKNSSPSKGTTLHPETAQMMIINPFSNTNSILIDLFKTHPSTAHRVQKLRSMQVPLKP